MQELIGVHLHPPHNKIWHWFSWTLWCLVWFLTGCQKDIRVKHIFFDAFSSIVRTRFWPNFSQKSCWKINFLHLIFNFISLWWSEPYPMLKQIEKYNICQFNTFYYILNMIFLNFLSNLGTCSSNMEPKGVKFIKS